MQRAAYTTIFVSLGFVIFDDVSQCQSDILEMYLYPINIILSDQYNLYPIDIILSEIVIHFHNISILIK